MAQTRPGRHDYPVGIPLRPPPGWKGRGAIAPPPLPPPPLVPPPVAPEPARYLALKTGLVLAMVLVCMGVGWLAVSLSRGPRTRQTQAKGIPAPIVANSPREESKPIVAEVPKEPKQEPIPRPPAVVLTFERHILPIMERSCTVCHGKAKKRGELDLSTYAALVKGGEGGTSVQPGKPVDSPLLSTILAGRMPPSGKKMPARDVELIRDWIQAGARSER